MSKLHLVTRSASTFLYALEFLISALILGIFSYFLAHLAQDDSNPPIPTWEKAVEGIAGAAVLYTIFAVLLTCFFGGITFFALIAVILDVCFCGGMVAIAVLARGGRHSCGSVNNSPIGPGNHVSCQLERATFIVAIIGAFLFLVSALVQVFLSRSHKREKRYGPSPSNNYTSGSGKRRPWQRKGRKTKGAHDAELGAFSSGGLGANGHEKTANRDSDITGTTAPVTDTGYGGPTNKYATHEPTIPSHHAGYTPQTTGTVGGPNPGVAGPAGAGHHSAVSEMDGSAAGGPENPYVRHDPNPYTEVHDGGYVHSNPESKTYTH